MIKYVGLITFIITFITVSASAYDLKTVQPSNGNFTPLPGFQDPIQCQEAQRMMSDTAGEIIEWFNIVLYGTAEQRLLNSHIAVRVKDSLIQISQNIVDEGRQKYRMNRTNSSQNNGDLICYEHIKSGRKELINVFNLIKKEAKLGNRILENTGIENIFTSYP